MRRRIRHILRQNRRRALLRNLVQRLRLEVSVEQEWRDETDRWLLGQCWLPLAIGGLVLKSFGGG